MKNFGKPEMKVQYCSEKPIADCMALQSHVLEE